jgi:hypothetical protein
MSSIVSLTTDQAAVRHKRKIVNGVARCLAEKSLFLFQLSGRTQQLGSAVL